MAEKNRELQERLTALDETYSDLGRKHQELSESVIGLIKDGNVALTKEVEVSKRDFSTLEERKTTLPETTYLTATPSCKPPKSYLRHKTRSY